MNFCTDQERSGKGSGLLTGKAVFFTPAVSRRTGRGTDRQPAAADKCTLSDLRDALRYRNGRKRGAVVKCQISDRAYSFRDDKFRKFAAAGKAAVSDPADRGGKIDPGQSAAAIKGMILKIKDSIRKKDLLQMAAA